MPLQARSQATFEAIVEATARIIEEGGLAQLTTNRVARVAGVSVGSLYQYFPNKEALVEEIRSRFAARFALGIANLVGELASLDARAAIRRVIEVLVALHEDSPGVHHALGAGSPDESRPIMRAIATSLLDSRARELRRPDRSLAARILLDVAESLVHTTSLREPHLLRDPAWVDEVCDLLERYLLRDAPSPRGSRSARGRGTPAGSGGTGSAPSGRRGR